MRGYKSTLSKVFDDFIEKMNIIEKELENTESKLSVVEKKVESIEPKLTELEEILDNDLIEKINNNPEGKHINGDRIIIDSSTIVSDTITDKLANDSEPKVATMSYHEAYELMQKGYKVARRGWDNKYKFIYEGGTDSDIRISFGFGEDPCYSGEVEDYSTSDWYVWE